MDHTALTAKLKNLAAVFDPYQQAQLMQEAAAAIEALRADLIRQSEKVDEMWEIVKDLLGGYAGCITGDTPEGADHGDCTQEGL